MSKKTATILKIAGIAVGAVGVVAAGIVVATKFLNKKKTMRTFDGVTEDDLADILPGAAEKVAETVADAVSTALES